MNNKQNQVINYGYFHAQGGELKRLINEAGALASDALSLDGTKPMTGDLDMTNHNIINLRPTKKDNALNKQYMDTAVFNKVDKNDAILLDGSNKMVAGLDMKQKITKLSTDTADVLSATNVMYVNQAKADLTVSLTASLIKR